MPLHGNINSWIFQNNSPAIFGGGIPLQSDALFWLDGTLSGSEFVDKSGNGRNFTITSKDFTASYFPYKSAATISAPVGDATLIAADINNFLYDSGGDPNAIPVVSFFQNIDYEDKLFSRHVAQVTDANGVETTEPHVKDIVLYSAVLTGADLTTANTYYSVPTQVTTNVIWVAKDGHDTTGDGSKTTPYLTIIKGESETPSGGTLYLKTGEYTESFTIKGDITIQGTGRTKNINTAAYNVYTDPHDNLTFKHIWFYNADDRILYLQDQEANFLLEKCYLERDTGTQPIIYKVAAANTVSFEVKDCVLQGQINVIDSTVIDGCLFINHTDLVKHIQVNDDALIDHCIFKETNLLAGFGMLFPQVDGISITVNDCITTGLLLSSTLTAITFDIEIKYSTLNGGVNTSTIYADGAYTSVDATITNNTIISTDNNPTNEIIHNIAGTFVCTNNVINGVVFGITTTGQSLAQTCTISDNTITATTKAIISAYDIVATIENNILDSDESGVVCVGDLGTAQVQTVRYNKIITRGDTPEQPFLKFGTEGDVSTYGMSNGSQVIGNDCYGPRYFGKDVGAQHGIFIFAQALELAYNRVNGVFLGLVVKSAGISYATNTHHNIYTNCSAAWTIKGAPDVQIYNDTCVMTDDMSDTAGQGLQHLYDNVYPGSFSTGLMFKNNIIADYRSTTDISFFGTTSDDMVDSEFDYNIYYKVAGTKFCRYPGPGDTSFATWQALPQDVNSSQVDPGFTNVSGYDFSLATGGGAIGAGETLAAAYDDGLDASTDWGDASTVPSVVTKQQTAPWDIGAYVS